MPGMYLFGGLGKKPLYASVYQGRGKSIEGGVRVSVDGLAAIPEEEMWLASRKSARTRRAYQNDMANY